MRSATPWALPSSSIPCNGSATEHGPEGVTGFAPAYGRTDGAITDDTQMTLWTADGLLRARAAPEGTDPVASLHRSVI